MIYNKLKNIDLYKGLYPNLDIAIDYIKKGEYTSLPLGKHDIVGKDVATTPFETHKPACAAPGKDKAIKKCIFKVLV